MSFFYNLYPWSVNKTICHNYGVFIASYKMLELILISVKNISPNEFNAEHMIKIISSFAQRIDHNHEYKNRISKNLDNKDTLQIMNSFLQS